MPKQHFIIQGGESHQGDTVEHQQGGCCGAVCLTYLIGEVIDEGNLNRENEHNIFVDCRQKTKIDIVGAPTNPFKIQCYLNGNNYSDVVAPLLEGISFNVVPKIWEASEDDNDINKLYGSFMRTDAGATFPNDIANITEASPMAKQAFTMDDGSFFLGVFMAKGGGIPRNPADLHYILLKMEGSEICFNNPHNNMWMNAGIDRICGGFNVEGGKWVWVNYGLYITVVR